MGPVRDAQLRLFALHWTSSGVMPRFATNATNALAGPSESSFCAVSQLEQSAVQGTSFFEQEPNRLSLKLLQFTVPKVGTVPCHATG